MRRVIVAILISAFVIPSAFAEGVIRQVKPMKQHPSHLGIGRMDNNGDGKIDFEEFSKGAIERAEKTFDKIDVDADGTITKDEFLQYSLERSKAQFERMDKNGDSFLTSEDAQLRRHDRPGGGETQKKEIQAE